MFLCYTLIALLTRCSTRFFWEVSLSVKIDPWLYWFHMFFLLIGSDNSYQPYN